MKWTSSLSPLPNFSCSSSLLHPLVVGILLTLISANKEDKVPHSNRNDGSNYFCSELRLHFLHTHHTITITAIRTTPPAQPRAMINVLASAKETKWSDLICLRRPTYQNRCAPVNRIYRKVFRKVLWSQSTVFYLCNKHSPFVSNTYHRCHWTSGYICPQVDLRRW